MNFRTPLTLIYIWSTFMLLYSHYGDSNDLLKMMWFTKVNLLVGCYLSDWNLGRLLCLHQF